MKKKLLSIVLAISTLLTCMFAFSGCGVLDKLGDLGKKDDFTKAVEAVENCVIDIEGDNTVIHYEVAENGLYLRTYDPINGTRHQKWIVEGNSYRHWTATGNGSYTEDLNKTKAEYQSARMGSYYIMFGCFVKNSKKFEYDDKYNHYKNIELLVYPYNDVDISSALGQDAGTTIGTAYYTFDGIIINLDSNGKITSATYNWVESYDESITTTRFAYTCTLSVGSATIEAPNA